MSDKELAQELRDKCVALRKKPMPLAELIPLLQRAADALDAGPTNPYAGQGSLEEAWKRGYDERPMLASPGSAYARVYGEGRNAAVADAGKTGEAQR